MAILDRRAFLRTTGLAGLALGLAACGDDGGTTGSASGGGFGAVKLQLSWKKNVEFAGEYFADTNGHFKNAGFTQVELLSGGGSGTSVESGLATGRCWAGLSAPTITAPAVLQGAQLKIVGATFQKNPFAIVSLNKNPIKEAKDLAGKKIGVQDSNELVWNALLKANGLDASSVTRVPFQSDPSMLTSGQLDGYVGFVTSGPVNLRMQGHDPAYLLLADAGLPLVAETFTVTQETIDNERDKLKAFLTAEIKGWKDAVADPAKSAELAATVYGKDQNLDVKEQTEEAKMQNELVVTPDAKANGLFTMTPELIGQNIESLAKAGLNIKAEQLFDLSILNEIYQADPSLKPA
ncbi:ABC transporter substrate-binding protein [Nonomuraea fuscirosea]|jgi:ABC-type nitrate/sulfonate/bicarbonate transport system substrate-binding protein|uniref:ABC-type nitrate/sulfonate/bicarbonate transport system substrate-binding protein n=1 Tax=Nonomuraea fuscirosea TaxID=1291556 RepID=A0A2T0ML72_9ACTN|nr:ABC transporter substrate-binding protein [Nonomuraea fuscirosea]PRX58381.1 ABC-type nitrate/sulfonate/bicarbonate transport system substrate-binding protein [Nonomuraea fuscirosea]WSA53262.1 ABC transporter substrate-binding protein [Nonomuraea fuscirosea]